MLQMTKNTRMSVLSMCLGALLVPHKTRTEWNPKPLLIVGGLAALAFGAYCYASYENDETVAYKAQHYLNEIIQSYKADVDTFFAFHHTTSYPVNMQQLINSADEDNELYPTAERVRNSGSTMRLYLSEINNDLNTLKSHFSKLGSRKSSLERKKYLSTQEKQLLQNMHRIYEDLQAAVLSLGIYYEFFSAHRAYFDLYEYESELYKLYQQEFLYGNTYLYDTLALAQAIRQCVGTKYHSTSYPFHAYKRQLNEHIEKLQSFMKNTQWYTNRYGWAMQLEQYLIKVRGIIIADASYEKEKEARRLERQHQQQMQLMQQQQVMQQQLIAQQQQLAMQQAHNARRSSQVSYTIKI